MPCTTKARSSSFNPPSKRTNGRDVRVPSPVHSRAMKYHGFFGMPLLRQHLVFDKRWTPSSLMTQYQSINELLNRRIIFKAHEATSNRCHYGERSKKLRHQCIEGRSKLLQVNVGDDAHNIHNLLKNHKSMQRLYKRMPNYLIVDNINQRTFVMRKERDRLEFRLKQLKNKYKELLVERAIIRNRINYENAFVMKEELQSRILLKKIENSDVRLKAVRTINNTYQKIKQVLLHDEIFYEPILSSLDADIEDQANFINHIIYLGKPAISKFKLLDQKYRKLERDVRENILDKIRMLDSFKKARPPPNKKEELPLSANFRYVRETETMARLKYQLKTVEKVIKEVKLTALCSQAREIYERMRGQAKENENLHLSVKYDVMHHETLEMKHKFSTVLKGVLIDNLSEEEINRMERIKDLTNILRKDEQYELDTLEYVRDRAEVYAMLRVSTWNLVEILRHVDREPKSYRTYYPNSYLKLPLLRFDMLNKYSVPPYLYEENIDVIMQILKRKVYRLMKAYIVKLSPAIVKLNVNTYQKTFVDCIHGRGTWNLEQRDNQELDHEEEILLDRLLATIPNRKQLKAQSAKIIDDARKEYFN